MKLTPEQKEIAMRVANNMGFDAPPQLIQFAERFLADLPNSEPVGEVNYGRRCNIEWFDEIPDQRTQLYAAPPIPQDLQAQLAEGQAREARLRDMLISAMSAANTIVTMKECTSDIKLGEMNAAQLFERCKELEKQKKELKKYYEQVFADGGKVIAKWKRIAEESSISNKLY